MRIRAAVLERVGAERPYACSRPRTRRHVAAVPTVTMGLRDPSLELRLPAVSLVTEARTLVGS